MLQWEIAQQVTKLPGFCFISHIEIPWVITEREGSEGEKEDKVDMILVSL